MHNIKTEKKKKQWISRFWSLLTNDRLLAGPSVFVARNNNDNISSTGEQEREGTGSTENEIAPAESECCLVSQLCSDRWLVYTWANIPIVHASHVFIVLIHVPYHTHTHSYTTHSRPLDWLAS